MKYICLLACLLLCGGCVVYHFPPVDGPEEAGAYMDSCTAALHCGGE